MTPTLPLSLPRAPVTHVSHDVSVWSAWQWRCVMEWPAQSWRPGSW